MKSEKKIITKVDLRYNPYSFSKEYKLYVDGKDETSDENIKECLGNDFQITEKLIGYICDLANASSFQFCFTGERKHFLDIDKAEHIFQYRKINCKLEYCNIEPVDSLLKYLVDEEIIQTTNALSSNGTSEEDSVKFIAWTRTQFLENRDKLENELKDLEEAIDKFGFDKFALDAIKQSLLNDFRKKLKNSKLTPKEINKLTKEMSSDANAQLSEFERTEIEKSIYAEKMGNINRIQEDIHNKLNLNTTFSVKSYSPIGNYFMGALLHGSLKNPYAAAVVGIPMILFNVVIWTINRNLRNKTIDKYCDSVKIELYQSIENWKKDRTSEIVSMMRIEYWKMEDDFKKKEKFIKMTEI